MKLILLIQVQGLEDLGSMHISKEEAMDMAIRIIPLKIPTMEELGLPAVS